jgi:hypothetical protein
MCFAPRNGAAGISISRDGGLRLQRLALRDALLHLGKAILHERVAPGWIHQRVHGGQPLKGILAVVDAGRVQHAGILVSVGRHPHE